MFLLSLLESKEFLGVLSCDYVTQTCLAPFAFQMENNLNQVLAFLTQEQGVSMSLGFDHLVQNMF